MTIVTRTAFCEECEKAGRPKYGNRFLVHRSSHNDYDVKIAYKNGEVGFTPHIIVLFKVKGNRVFYDISCGMNGCDTSIVNNDAEKCFEFKTLKQKRQSVDINTWNQWMQFKDREYQI